MGKFRIQRSLDLLECISVLVGNVLGAGIFLANDVYKNIGSSAGGLCVFLFCGCIMSFGAYSLVELGCALPKYGGDYIYIYEAYGPLLGFLHIYGSMLITVPCSAAVVIITFAQNIVEAVLPACTNSEYRDLTNKLVATSAIFFVTYIHCMSVKFPTRLQNCFLFIKLTMLVLIIISGFLWIMINGVDNLKSPFKGTTKDAGSWALAIYYSVFSYSGWNFLTVLMEEIRNPIKTLPKAVNISVPIIVGAYVFVNFSYIAVLGIDGITNSAMLSLDYSKLALYLLKPWAMPAMVGFSTLGSISVSVMTVSRMCVAGARNGHLPELLHQINLDRLTPMPALIFTMILSAFMVIIPADLSTVLTYNTFVDSLFVFLSVSSCIVLRYRRPELIRPYKVPIALPYMFLFCYMILLIVPIIRYPVAVLIGIATLLSGVPVYYLLIVRHPRVVSKSSTRITHTLQKLLLTAAQDEEEDDDDNEVTLKKHDQTFILKRKSLVTRRY